VNRRPATHVSWYDAIVFANLLSIARGLRPAYELPNKWPDPDSWSTDPDTWGTVPTSRDPQWDNVQIAGGNPTGYRLPTEAQWEFAAKGGVIPEIYTFSGGNNPALVAWTSANSVSSPRMVGLLAANGLGIYDMSGNVWEWAQDWRDGGHPGGTQNDWTGAASGTDRVLRGGCFANGENHSRSVFRAGHDPSDRWLSIGFRLARPAP